MTPPIAILGAGPSGLLLGRLLDRANIDFTIFERDSSAMSAWGRGGSGTLGLHEGSGMLALEEAGLLDAFKKKARYDVPLTIANMHGKVLVKLDENQDTDRPEIDRRDLRSMLLDSVPKDRIQWGVKVEQVQQELDGTMAVQFAEGGSETVFRLVVGADGAWSKARSLLTPAIPEYSGRYYLTSAISPANPFYSIAESLVGTGNYMSMGGGRVVAAMRLGDGLYYTFAGLSLSEAWRHENAALISNAARLREVLVREHFADWATTNTDLIANSDGEFYVWPLYGLSVGSLPQRSMPGVTLVGDAAHLTPPSGEGVNVALFDSLQLAQQIVKHGVHSLDRAIEEYERSMWPRARETIEDAAMKNEMIFAEDAPAGLLHAFTDGFQNGGEK